MTQLKYTERLALAEQRRANKNRKTALLTAVALAGVLAVGGTIAYVTDATPAVENKFVPAQVSCVVSEENEGAIKKDVQVQNTSDVDAYIRAAVVINWVKADGTVLGTPVKSTDYEVEYGSGWTDSADGFWYYKSSVAPTEFTSNLIKSLSIADGVSAPEADCYLAVDILASAVQVDGEDAKGNRPIELAWNVDIADGQLKAATIMQ